MEITQITYSVELNPDLIKDKKEQGWTDKDIMKSLKKWGIHSEFVAGYSVYEVS